MTAISQKVPNFWQGISQQPDSKKFPGQAKDLVNGYPNFALGLQKRPGGEHLCTLPDAYYDTSTSKYHHIFRDKVEKYVLQFYQETKNNVTLPNIKVWLLDDGIPRFVDRSELFGNLYETDVHSEQVHRLELTFPNNGFNQHPGTSVVHVNQINTVINNRYSPSFTDYESVNIQVRVYNRGFSFFNSVNVPITHYSTSAQTTVTEPDYTVIGILEQAVDSLISSNFFNSSSPAFNPQLARPTFLNVDPNNRADIKLKWPFDPFLSTDDYIHVEFTLMTLLPSSGFSIFDKSDLNERLFSDKTFKDYITTTTNGITSGYQPALYTAAQELNAAEETYQAAQKAYALKKRGYSEVASDREQTVYFEITNDYSNGTRDQAIIDGILVDSNGVENYYKNGSVVMSRTFVGGSYYETHYYQGEALVIIDYTVDPVAYNYATGITAQILAELGVAQSDYSLGNNRTDEYPWFSGSEIYEFVETEKQLDDTANPLSNTPEALAFVAAEADYLAKKAALNTAWGNYTAAVNGIDYFNDTRSYAGYGVTAIPENYFTGATADDIEFLTDADTTYVLNKAKTVAWDETSLTPEIGNDVLISINIVDSTASIELKLEYTTPNGIPLTTLLTPGGASATSLKAFVSDFTNTGKWATSLNETAQLSFPASGITGGTPTTYTINFDGVDYTVTSESSDAAVVAQALVDEFNLDPDINAELGDTSGTVYIYVHKEGITPSTVSVTATGLGTVTSAAAPAVITARDPNVTPPVPVETETEITITLANTSISRVFSLSILESLVHIKFGERSNDDNNFDCSISDNSPANYLTVVQHEVASITNLPLYGKSGYKVKVYNTADVDTDDFWMEFQVEGEGGNFGLGNWIETTAPNVYTKIDPKTMPHVLFRQADGTFVLKPHTWDNRSVGDDVTNEAPSFIGKKINNMFFYRNRFGVLAGDSIVMTRAGDFENFFNKSAMAAADDDPIDIQATSTAPVELVYAGSSAVGLVLFGTTEQFLLTTDSDLLSPATAKINSLSKFAAREDLKAQSFGATNVFFSSTDRYLKTFEMIDISNTGSPRVVEQTIQVPKLLPADLNTASSSPSNSLLSLAKKEGTTMYHFKYYRTAEAQVANSWYKWEFTNPIIHHFYDRNTFYVVHADNVFDDLGDLISFNSQVVKYELDDADQTGVLDNGDGLRFDPYLDMFIVEPFKKVEQVNSLYFNNWSEAGLGTDVTVVDIPSQNWENYNYYFVEKDNSGAVVDIEKVEPFGRKNPTLNTGFGATANALIVDNFPKPYFIGDQTSRTLVIGIPYTFTLKLPTVYKVDADNNRTEADTVKNLILHRTKFETGVCGPLTYTIDVNGKDLWTNTIAATPSQSYTVGSLPVAEADTHTIPLYQRNTDLSITVSDSSLYPATLLSMTWEGRYTSKFYQ